VYGDRYTWAVAVVHLSPTEIEVVGVSTRPSLEERRWAREVVEAAGITTIRFWRRNVKHPREYVIQSHEGTHGSVQHRRTGE
jgi:hypothetical protein